MTRRPRRGLIPAALLAPALLAPVVPASAAPALEEQAEYIYDRYIVVLHDVDPVTGAPTDPDDAAQDATAAGAVVSHVYRHALRGFAAVIEPGEMEAVRSDRRINYVEEDIGAGSAGSDTLAPPWGLDRIDQRALPLDWSYSAETTGLGVTAYVLDSGIRVSHTDFGGRATLGADVTNGAPAPGGDCHGHGTHVAGTIGGARFGVAKRVSLVGVRVLDCRNSGRTSWFVAGVDWVTGHHTGGPAVANMSLNGPPSRALDEAVRASIRDGIAYTISAGNHDDDACRNSPARVTEAMVVGASDANDYTWEISNYGPCVDWYAPGVDVKSASHESDIAVTLRSGTSMAAPHTAGAVARYLELDPLASPAKVQDYLWSRTTRSVVIDEWTQARYHLLYVDPPETRVVEGSITITGRTGYRVPTFAVSGHFKTDYDCSLAYSPIAVTCTQKPMPDVSYACSAIVNTATAPAPGDVGGGYVSTRANCDGPGQLATRDVYWRGSDQAKSWTPVRIDLGTAKRVVCRAAGVEGAASASGSYVAQCTATRTTG